MRTILALAAAVTCILMGVQDADSSPSISRQYSFSSYQSRRGNSQQQVRGDNSTFNIVCYFYMDHQPFTSPLPPPINVSLCSHIIFLGTYIKDAEMTPSNASDEAIYYSKVATMKKLKPSLKVLLCNGGNFSQVLNTQENRTKFARSTVPWMRKYGFDGLDMDWEFPTFGHPPARRHNLTLLVKTIRELFDADQAQSGGSRLLLSMAVSAGEEMISSCYEVAELAKYVDFVNVMTYDMHLYLEVFPFTGLNSPLYPGDDVLDRTIFKNRYFVWSANEWVRQGMKKSQVMTGIPTYSRTYTLLDEKSHGLYSLAKGVGRIGDSPAYDTVCELAKNTSTTVVWDDQSKVPYLYQEDLWISYDNVRSVTLKTQYLLQQGFGGAMVYMLNADDYRGSCDGKTKWPLFKAINAAVADFVPEKGVEVEYDFREYVEIDVNV
ncbi:acidic mammalian chitinase-like [Haliotis rubra]|uniref:acidic mammalian chitinase-like n=1 Tax=Haliotis rubra TaxID=36100 RepID=UPI001EE56536|nr:acidic mammalian chitinase-like [Haliotis rubra]XP_046573248.1 acidic mammalian chitinase-like [Haliotis rubra]